MNIRKYKVIILPQFKNEFYKIFGHVFRDSTHHKKYYKLFNQIIKKLQQLEDMPEIYAKTEMNDELGRKYRKIIIKQYIILYCVDKMTCNIYIAHIFYKRSDYFCKI